MDPAVNGGASGDHPPTAGEARGAGDQIESKWLALEGGLTLVEVMVSMALLLTAVLGMLALSDAAAQRTTETKGREGAATLARQALEGAASLPYANVSTSGLAPGL